MKTTIIKILLILMVTPVFAQRTQTLVNPDTNPKFQLSLIYPISTNGWSAMQTKHAVSIHLIAGATGGTDGVEIAGFGNYNSQSLKGVQASGFANFVAKDVKGVQAAGFTSICLGNSRGVQANGFSSFTLGKHNGVQGSGFLNYSNGLEGIQAAGFTNVNIGKSKGSQVSGFLNTSIKGFDGIQIAGFTNVALKESKGAQISAMLNIAQKMEGIQIGVFNYADTLDGLAIGLLSYSKNGLHDFEISSNETFHANLAFRTGTPLFYNIFSSGIHWSKENPKLAVGYGIGTQLMNTENWALSLELSSSTVLPEDNDLEYWTSLNSLRLSTTKKFNDFDVFAGVALNALFYQNDELDTDFVPWKGIEGKDGQTNYIIYPGFQIGVRL